MIAELDKKKLLSVLHRLMPSWESSGAKNFSFLPFGYSNSNYRFEHNDRVYVLRIPARYGNDEDWKLENRFYSDAKNINKAELVAFDTDSGAMITKWVDGQILAEVRISRDDIIRYVQILHNGLKTLPAHSSISYDPVDESRTLLERYRSKVDSEVLEISRAAHWNPELRTICHNDLNPWNVICSGKIVESWTTLDWGSVALNDPLFDLVTIVQGLQKEQSGIDVPYLIRIATDMMQYPVESRRITELLVGFWLREYVWAFSSYEKGNNRDEIKSQMTIATEKLQFIKSFMH